MLVHIKADSEPAQFESGDLKFFYLIVRLAQIFLAARLMNPRVVPILNASVFPSIK